MSYREDYSNPGNGDGHDGVALHVGHTLTLVDARLQQMGEIHVRPLTGMEKDRVTRPPKNDPFMWRDLKFKPRGGEINGL